MTDAHEPRDEFIDQLEAVIAREARQRRRVGQPPRWLPASSAGVIAGLVIVIISSMGAGAAAVLTAYQVQDAAGRDQLLSSLEQSAALARQGVDIATKNAANTERQISVGLADSGALNESRLKVAEAQAQVDDIRLKIEEVRLSGREPRTELSAPRVSSRDFVSEHLRRELSPVQMRVTAANARVQVAQRKHSLGLEPSNLDEARASLGEAQAMVDMFQQKLDIRQKFLTGAVDAIETDLRGLEVEATQRRAALAPQVELAREDERRTTAQVQVGLAQQIDVLQATTRRLQLEVALTDADMQLALVRQKIVQHRVGR
jgi:hypothetical protein